MVTGIENKQPVEKTQRTPLPRRVYTCEQSSIKVNTPCINVDMVCIKNPQIQQFVNIEIGDIHEIPDSVKNHLKNNLAYFYFQNAPWSKYKVEDDKGINYQTVGLRESDVVLAKYAQKVAEDMNVATCCYTGTKHALWAAGVINDYGDMPKGSAHQANEYFDKYPDKFKKLDIDPTALDKLPAGVILVYEKEGKHGHIDITNGNGQGMSDCFDNLGWLKEHGEGATVHAYQLTDGWKYNPETKKLEFKE